MFTRLRFVFTIAGRSEAGVIARLLSAERDSIVSEKLSTTPVLRSTLTIPFSGNVDNNTGPVLSTGPPPGGPWAAQPAKKTNNRTIPSSGLIRKLSLRNDLFNFFYWEMIFK